MSQKPCRIIRKTWISHQLVWRQLRELVNGKFHLLISGHKCEYELVQINKDIVCEENKTKLLGITIDDELIFGSHILNIYWKANKKLSVSCNLKNISAAKDTL